MNFVPRVYFYGSRPYKLGLEVLSTDDEARQSGMKAQENGINIHSPKMDWILQTDGRRKASETRM